jgi:hypothetical protein
VWTNPFPLPLAPLWPSWFTMIGLSIDSMASRTTLSFLSTVAASG